LEEWNTRTSWGVPSGSIHCSVQAPRPLLSSANSKLAGAWASDQIAFGNIEVIGNQVLQVKCEKDWCFGIFQLILKIIIPTSLAVSESHWEFPHRAVQEFAMPSEDWMTVSIRKASPQASGSEEAPGRVQWAMWVNIRTN